MIGTFGRESRVSTQTLGPQFDPNVVALDDGSVFFTYQSNADLMGPDLIGRVGQVSSDGNLSFSPSFTLRDDGLGEVHSKYGISVVDGNYILLTYFGAAGLNQSGYVASLVDTSSQAITSSTIFQDTSSVLEAPATVLDTGNGNFTIITTVSDITVFNPTVTIFEGSTDGTSLSFGNSFAALSGGQADIVQFADSSYILSADSHFVFEARFRNIGFDPTGAVFGGAIQDVPLIGGQQGPITVTGPDEVNLEALSSGQAFITLTQSGDVERSNILISLLDVENRNVSLSDGQIIGPYLNASGHRTLTLDDGRILVTWTQGEQSFSGIQTEGRDIVATVGSLRTDGQFSFSEYFIVNDDTVSDQFDVEVTQSASGEIIFTYTSDSVLLNDLSGSSVVSRTLDLDAIPGNTFEGNDSSEVINGGLGYDTLNGAGGNDTIDGGDGNDQISGGNGDDSLLGGDGGDTLNGSAGNDTIIGGTTINDIRDVVFAGEGNDLIDGGYGNDELRGDSGNDTIAGGFGADTVIGGTGDDLLTGSALGDNLFGGDGDDFVNGGFGFDRINGGAGADEFFHIGIANHGSDWLQDYTSAEGDVLVFGNANATRAQFQINVTTTPTAGASDVEEAFVIYRPTGQIIWALVDGDGQDEINLRIGGDVFDLMS